MKNIKKYKMIFVIILSVTMSLFLMDYLNVFYKCGISIGNVNMEFWNIFINGFIVVILYIITYLAIDKKQIKQLDNKRNIAKLLLVEAYEKCLSEIEWMDKDDYRKHVASRVDFKDYLNENPTYKKIAENPFYNQEMILSFAKEGIISSTHLENYLNVRKEFGLFLTTAIMLRNNYQLATKQKETVQKIITDSLQNVEEL